MDEVDEFEQVAHLQEHFYRLGNESGLEDGKLEGYVDGQKMGYSKGYSLSCEVGFYLGVMDLVQYLSDYAKQQNSDTDTENGVEAKGKSQSGDPFGLDKLKKTLEALRSSAEQYDDKGVLQVDVLEQLHTIRSKFKLLSSQLGIKLRFTGTTVDKVAEDQLPAGMPPVDF